MVKVIDQDTIKVEPGISYKNGFLGVDVDVFPIDGQPDDENEYRKWHAQLMKLYKTYSLSVFDYRVGSLKRRVLGPVYRFALGNKKRIMAKSQKLHSIYPIDNSRFVGCVEMPYNV